LGARGTERGHAARFVETFGVQKHPGEAGERLDRDAAEAHAVTDLTEHLPGYCAVARARLLGEAGENDRAVGADRMPRGCCARAEVQRSEARAPIAGEIRAVDIGRARPRAHTRGRIGVAAGQAGAPLAEAAIEAGEDAAEVAV